jgi:hypothetical protein
MEKYVEAKGTRQEVEWPGHTGEFSRSARTEDAIILNVTNSERAP